MASPTVASPLSSSTTPSAPVTSSPPSSCGTPNHFCCKRIQSLSSPSAPVTPILPLNVFPLSASPVSACSPFQSPSAFLASLNRPASSATRTGRIPTPKTNSSLLLAAAAFAAAAAVAVESSAGSPAVGDGSGIQLRRRRRGTVCGGAVTPARSAKRRHTVHSDRSTSASSSDEVRLTEEVLDKHQRFSRESSDRCSRLGLEDEVDGTLVKAGAPMSAAAKRILRGKPDKADIRGDITVHCSLLYLYCAFHMLVLVFTCDFYPKLNGMGDLKNPYAPRYGADEWSFYQQLNVSIIAFMKSSVVWAVIYAVALKAVLFFLTAGHLERWLHRLYGLWCLTCITVNLSVFLFGGMDSKCLFFPDVWVGSWYEGWRYDPQLFGSFSRFDLVLFAVGMSIDLVGLWMLVRGAMRHLHRWYDAFIPIMGIALLMSIGVYFMAENPRCNSSDHHWVDFASHHPHNIDVLLGDSSSYNPLRFPVYVPMRDGTKIAVDIYLPKNYIHGFRESPASFPPLPTYVDITRYDRRMTALWPFTMLRIWKEPRSSSVNVWSWQFVQALIPNGYAVVVVDSRGTGASEGHRTVDFSTEEMGDFAEIVGWVKQQWWSNSQIGMGGISYDGMTGLQAAAMGGVKAAVALFTPMDVIGDLLAPGGMVCSSFVRDYVGLTAKFEEEGTPFKHHLSYPWQYPLHVIMGFLSSFGHASPVNRHETVAAQALKDHEKNWDMSKVVQQVEYLDDNITLMDGRTLPVASFGINDQTMENLAANNVSMYIAGGYCDSAIVRGSSRLYEYMNEHAPSSRPKLVVGPWTHSGRRSCSPYMGSYPCFENAMYLDLVRFLDCHLKDKCWGDILEEPPVRYWQVGEETWKTSDHYPPKNVEYTELHFSNQPLGADLQPLESEVPEGIVMVNNTVIGELHEEEEEATELEWELSLKHTSLLEHVVHDITQLTYIRLKRPGSHHLHHYHRKHRSRSHSVHQTLHRHREFLSRDSYLLKPKRLAYVSASVSKDRIQRHYSGRRNAFSIRTAMVGSSSTVHDVVSFKVDYRATTGIFSRWLIAQHPFRMAVSYGNLLFPSRASVPMRQRQQQENSRPAKPTDNAMFSSRLSFTTVELTESVAIVGSPWVKFSVYVSGCTEVSLFCYLEDVDLTHGYSHYVTEGKVAASHRVTEDENKAPVGSPDVVHRTYSRKNYIPVHGSELVEMSLTLEPVSWTFQKGHAIRISLAGADVDNFELRDHAGILPVLPDKWQIIVNDPENFPAWIRLPILKDDAGTSDYE